MSPSLTRHEVRLALAFHKAAMQQGRCAGCGYRGYALEAHHGIQKSSLKRLLASKGRPTPPEILWDPRNAVLMCGMNSPNNCHEHHTNRSMPLSRAALPAAVFEFAEETGLSWLLEKLYPEPQTREAA